MEYSPYRQNNDVQVFFDGNELFDEIIESLKKAKKSINIQFYIFKSDKIGSKILNILRRKEAGEIVDSRRTAYLETFYLSIYF